MMYVGRGVWETVKNLYSFSKYLSQVQKQLRCGPFLQRMQSSGKPKTAKQSQCNTKCAMIGSNKVFWDLGRSREGAGWRKKLS